MTIRLALADELLTGLDGLELLCRLEEDFQVAARCRNGEEALRAVVEVNPDILILDISPPGRTGLSVLKELKERGLPTRVVLVTGSLNEGELLEAMRLGARGVVLKDTAADSLVECIRKVHGGGKWIPIGAAAEALENLATRGAAEQEIGTILTSRELDVVRMIVEGLRNKEIAERLFLSEGTVKIHLHHIYQKLRVESRLELAAYARRKGL